MEPATREDTQNGGELPRPLFSPSRLLDFKFGRFLLVGGSAALAYIAISTALVSVFPDRGRLISVAVYMACIPFAFLAQREVTFRSKGPQIREFLKYAVLQVFAVSSSTLFIGHFITKDPVSNAIVFFCINALATLINYAICHFLVFRPR